MEANKDAASVAILLDAEVKDRIFRELVILLLGDNPSALRAVFRAAEQGDDKQMCTELRRQLALSIVHEDTYRAAMRAEARQIVNESISPIMTMVREEFARGIIHNAHKANKPG